ncbi:MAG: OmpA family protein [Pseudomonadota bacterium]|nr:OmpA family protein [Pseudomonadota bacterium]
MKLRALVLALASASTALPNSAHAAEDICSRLIIQAVNQFCQLLPNGLNLCQPVALVGPNPQCSTSEPQALIPVPLGPATLQPLASWAAPYAQAWPATQVAANIPLSTRAAVAAPASPVAPTPPEPPHITADIAKPVAAARPATPTAATAPVAPVIAPITTVAAPLLAPVAAAALTPSIVAPATAAPSEIPAPVVAASVAPVAEAAIASVAPATRTEAAPLAQPLPAALPVAVATAVATTPAIEPPAAPVAAPPPATQTLAAEEASVDALAHFDFDSANLTPVGRAVLDAWLTEAPKDKTVRVSGYADRLGPEPYNLKLSLRRAEAVKQYLAGKGYDPRRIQLEAKGEAEPVKSCKGDATAITKACLAPNRRVKIDPE